MLERGQKIVFEGDSLTSRRTPPSLDTWPFLRLMGWDRTWADDFSEMLFSFRPDLRLEFHNSAVGGSTIDDVLNRFEKSLAPHKPAWVFMTIGNNDPARKIPLKSFSEKISRFTGQVSKVSGGRVAFLGGTFKTKNDARKPFHDELRRLAPRHGGLYIDIGSALRSRTEELKKAHKLHTIHSDDGHLNRVGNLIVAGTVLRALGFEWE